MKKIKLIGDVHDTVVCKCGYYNKFSHSSRATKVICKGCGYWVYRTRKIEFAEKLKKELKK